MILSFRFAGVLSRSRGIARKRSFSSGLGSVSNLVPLAEAAEFFVALVEKLVSAE